MIIATEVLGWVSSKLNLSRYATQPSIDTFLRDLEDGISILARKFPNLRKSEDFTTVAGDGLFKLDVTVRPLRIMDITSPWTYKIVRLQSQQMREYLLMVSADTVTHPYASYSDQPSYWAYYPSSNSGDIGDIESPGAWIRFADQSKIAADLTLTIEYTYIPRLIKARSTGYVVDMGEEYKLALCAYVAWQQAVKYSREIGPQIAGDMKELFSLEIQQLKVDHRKSLQSNEIEFTEILPY